MIPEWLSGLGDSVYSWGKENPMDALSLGVGAAGTGMGIFDQYRTNKQANDRRKLAEQFSRQGPAGSMPNWSPQQLQAMYFRPAAQFMAERGQTQGGSFTQALADAALKAESDRNQIGNQWFNSRVSALGAGQPVPASGSMGAFGQALQNIQLRKALAGMPQGVGRNLMDPEGAAWGQGVGADAMPNRGFNNPYDMNVPNYQLYSGNMLGGDQGGFGQYRLTDFGAGQGYGAGAGDGRWGLGGGGMSYGGTNAQGGGVPGFYPEEAMGGYGGGF